MNVIFSLISLFSCMFAIPEESIFKSIIDWVLTACAPSQYAALFAHERDRKKKGRRKIKF
jgi:hypothetical protein